MGGMFYHSIGQPNPGGKLVQVSSPITSWFDHDGDKEWFEQVWKSEYFDLSFASSPSIHVKNRSIQSQMQPIV